MMYQVLIATGLFVILAFTGIIVYELICEATRTWRYERRRKQMGAPMFRRRGHE